MADTEKAYIAGPMGGIEDFNFELFHEAGSYITQNTDWEVVNPAKEGDIDDEGNATKDRHEYMRRAFKELSECDVIVLLDGWKDSNGARAEVRAAIEIGLRTYRFTYDTAGNPNLFSCSFPETVLRDAERLIRGNRNSDYGHPADNFALTAKMWSGLLGYKLNEALTAEDVAMCMMCIKMSREQNRHDRDNIVDMAGYAGTLEMIREVK